MGDYLFISSLLKPKYSFFLILFIKLKVQNSNGTKGYTANSLPLVSISQQPTLLVSCVSFQKIFYMHTRNPPFFSLLHKWLYGTNHLYIERKIKLSLHNPNSLYEHLTVFYKEISFKTIIFLLGGK